DQGGSEKRNAGGVVHAWKAAQDAGDGWRVSLRKIPTDVCNRAQHRIEHDGARGVRGDAERTADRPVIVGEEEQGIAADRSKPCHIGWWLTQNEAGDEAVFAEELRIFEQLCQLLAVSGISGRAEKAEYHPASGADVQIEGAAG